MRLPANRANYDELGDGVAVDSRRAKPYVDPGLSEIGKMGGAPTVVGKVKSYARAGNETVGPPPEVEGGPIVPGSATVSPTIYEIES